MDIRREVVDVLSKSIDAEKNEAFFQVKLQELGISSIDFFKIMISLSKTIGIRLQDLDPAKVTTNMNTEELIKYLTNKKV
jgi:acyl carrier protein